MMAFGIIGYYMRKYGYSNPALIIAVILGPIVEKSFLKANMLFDGNLLMFFQKPISAIFIISALLVMFFPLFRMIFRYSSKILRKSV